MVLDKLKQLGESLKQLVLFVVLPILGIVFYILKLKSDLTTAKEQIVDLKANQDLIESENKEKEAENEANNAEVSYDTIRDKYLRDSGISVSKPDSVLHPAVSTTDSSSGQGNKEKR